MNKSWTQLSTLVNALHIKCKMYVMFIYNEEGKETFKGHERHKCSLHTKWWWSKGGHIERLKWCNESNEVWNWRASIRYWRKLIGIQLEKNFFHCCLLPLWSWCSSRWSIISSSILSCGGGSQRSIYSKLERSKLFLSLNQLRYPLLFFLWMTSFL